LNSNPVGAGFHARPHNTPHKGVPYDKTDNEKCDVSGAEVRAGNT